MTTTTAHAAPAAPLAPPGAFNLGRRRVAIELKSFFRDKNSAVWNFALPMLLMIIFGSVFGGQTLGPTGITFAQYFVAGMIADLEHSILATSKATEKATFGITSAQRAARSLDRLKSAQSKLNHPILAQTISVAQSVSLKLNNKEQLAQAAGKINELGVRFGATVSGDELTAIDSFVPPKNKWK